MKAFVVVLSLLIGLSSCGGKKVSTGPSRNTVSFVNEFFPGQISGGSGVFVIDIPAAHQHFELAETERKAVELVADDGSTEFEFTVTRKGTEDTKEGAVSVGQEVVITSKPVTAEGSEGYRVYVDGEEVLG